MPFLQRLDGRRLYQELHGPEGGEPLILLEGLGGDIPGWRQNIPRLASEFRVVAYDFRGNGRSSTGDGPMTMANRSGGWWPRSSPSHIRTGFAR